jgi:hypothetical protein
VKGRSSFRVTIEIDTENDAFQVNLADEVARVLTSFARAIVVDGLDPDMVGLDSNGNRCAKLEVR